MKHGRGLYSCGVKNEVCHFGLITMLVPLATSISPGNAKCAAQNKVCDTFQLKCYTNGDEIGVASNYRVTYECTQLPP